MSPRRFLALTLALFLVAAELPARTQLKPGRNAFSKEQDVELGREAAKKIEQQVKVIDDAALRNYITDLGRRLYSTVREPDANYPFNFHVVADKGINAFALPGGPLYINTGTIVAADNEAQLSGVIGHEIAHVIMRHSTNQITKAQTAQLPLAILGAVLGNGAAGQLTNIVAQLGVGSVFLKFSRDAERQADLLGTQMLYDAGYNPEEMARFFQKLSAEGGRGPEFFSSHPDPGNRMALVQAEARTLGSARTSTALTDRFQAMKRLAQQWNNRAPSPNQKGGQTGATSGGTSGGSTGSRPEVNAGGTFRSYNGSGFRISHPEGWNASAQENTVLIAPQQGVMNDGIAYGVMISVLEPQEQRGVRLTLSEATRQLLEQLAQQNPDMRRSGGTRSITINGIGADSITLSNKSPLPGETEIDWLVTMWRPDGMLFYVIFIAPERDFNRLKPSFDQMLNSLQLAN